MKAVLSALLFVTSALLSAPVHAGMSIRVIASDGVEDTVKNISEDKDGASIAFARTAGNYRLRRTVANYDAKKKSLQNSLSNKKPVSVTVDSSQLNILDVK